MKRKRGPHFCSLKITEEVRKYAAEQGITEKAALKHASAIYDFVVNLLPAEARP